jgi:hypothetical protein
MFLALPRNLFELGIHLRVDIERLVVTRDYWQRFLNIPDGYRVYALKSMVSGGRLPNPRFELHKFNKIFQIWNTTAIRNPLLSM